MKWLIFAGLLAALFVAWRGLAFAAQTPTAGQPAPPFNMPDQNGKTISLEQLKGKWVALYFYPKDDTPGCTEQACAFRDDLHLLTQMGCEVIGVSVDSSAECIPSTIVRYARNLVREASTGTVRTVSPISPLK